MPTRPHPILLLGSQMTVAGAQRLLLAQADWLYQQGYPVTAAFFYDRDGLAEEWQAGRAYPLIDLRFFLPKSGKKLNLFQFLGGLWRLWRLLRTGHFKAIETFTHDANLIGCPLAWLAGIPIRLATHHGHIGGRSAFVERIHAWTVNLGLATRLVAVSADIYQRSLSEGVQPQHIVTIANGIEPRQPDPQRAAENRRSLPGDPSGPVLLAVGRLTEQKGHDVLLNAMPQILGRHPAARLAIAGEGPLRDALIAQAVQLGIASQVVFLGVRADVAEWMSIADVFVLPSRWEGLPLVLLEAMNASCPIVSTRVAGVSEVLEQNVSGRIVEPGDAAALAAAIIDLLDDPLLRMKFGQAARQRFDQQFQFKKMAQQYLQQLDPDCEHKQVVIGE